MAIPKSTPEGREETLLRDDPRATESNRPRDRREQSDDGVDVSLIRWMLGLSPAQRLDVLQNSVDAILDMRREGSEP